jgi:hypothetical protein
LQQVYFLNDAAHGEYKILMQINSLKCGLGMIPRKTTENAGKASAYPSKPAKLVFWWNLFPKSAL